MASGRCRSAGNPSSPLDAALAAQITNRYRGLIAPARLRTDVCDSGL
ncbi:MAG UNVERIFIED_CONTAM: hypothetical protein LVR18_22325 [Planctomycetaceae bacterium]